MRKDIPGQGSLFDESEYIDHNAPTKPKRLTAKQRKRRFRGDAIKAIRRLADEQRFIYWDDLVKALGGEHRVDDAALERAIMDECCVGIVRAMDGPTFLQSVALEKQVEDMEHGAED